MSLCMIFDESISVDDLVASATHTQQPIILFPLTSNAFIVKQLCDQLQRRSSSSVTVIDSAQCINQEVTTMQAHIHAWSLRWGEKKVANRHLKSWLMLPDKGVSSWWFSMISEKNSVQDDVFFKIAQVNAIKHYLSSAKHSICMVAVQDKMLRDSVLECLNTLGVSVTRMQTPKHTKKITRKQKLLYAMTQAGLGSALLSAMVHLSLWWRQGRLARRKMAPLSSRLKGNHPLLFTSYFPNIDEDAAKRGILRNRYAEALQAKCAELTLPLTWLMMPVYYNGHDFASAVNLAKRFHDQGEKIFLLQEFYTWSVLCKSLYYWLRQLCMSILLRSGISFADVAHPLAGSECAPLMRYLWWHSLVGTSGIRGIIFYLTYKEVFKQIRGIEKCVYYCEMQAWEKACVAAKNQCAPQATCLAFQHTVVMRNYFNYFYAKDEVVRTRRITDMPLPDKIIANGQLMYALLSESSYPNLCQAEAVRQLYLNRLEGVTKNRQSSSSDPSICLLVGSCDRRETKALISLFLMAFPEPPPFEVWIKGSPVNPVEPLFSALGVSFDQTYIKICKHDVAQALGMTSIAFVANTTVAIEAVGFGCEVMIPVLADTMLMNPIIDTTANYTLITTPIALRTRVLAHYAGNVFVTENQQNSFIHHYWNLDAQLPLWTQLLTA